ncbi:MAG: hypothetical protein ACYDAL_16245, partial [Candidatus Dormibacteraceae bacterium]
MEMLKFQTRMVLDGKNEPRNLFAMGMTMSAARTVAPITLSGDAEVSNANGARRQERAEELIRDGDDDERGQNGRADHHER